MSINEVYNTLPSDYQKYIHLSRYARWDDEKKRRENWPETVGRYMDFMCDVQCKGKITPEVKEDLRQAILRLEVMPSMRALMTSGEALKRDNVSAYNCSFIAVTKPKVFDEVMYILMCGVGVGFSVERQYIAQLPSVAETMQDSNTVIQVADSKIGWCNALKELIHLLYSGTIPHWDVSKVRPAGARLKTFGGRASGPGPLEELFKFTIQVFKNAIGRKLNSLECHDLICSIGRSVLVGGVRRSALISLSNLSDDRMRTAKTGEWHKLDPQRSIANNSVAYTEKPEMLIFMKEWLSLTESKNGERGIFNRVAVKKKVVALGRRDPNHEFGINPCSEIILRGSGGLCNLSEIVVRADDTADSLMKKAERAAILGTMQASLTNFRYLSSEWKKNAEEEALLGVSLTGIMDNPVMNGKATDEQRIKFYGSKDKLVSLESFLATLKDRVVEVNKKWAKKLGINAAAATTCVKPSGTVSQLVNSSSGIHARYSPHHIRRVRSDKKDPLGQFLKNSGFPCEDDVMSPDNNLVFSFPMKSPDCSVFRSDLTAIQQLEIWLIYDKYWCEHKVSCFTGRTKFITDKGIMSFDEVLQGNESGAVMVMNRRGKFVPATARSFGKDEIWEVHLNSGKKKMIIETTSSHLWPVTYAMQRWSGWPEKQYKTNNLPIGKQLVSVYPDIERKFILEAFLRGVVFGDGSQYNKHRKKNRYCKVDLCNEKRELASFFEKAGYKIVPRNDINQTRIYGLPGHWKDIPSDRFYDGDYIYSFIMGWFSTDGFVSEKGDMMSISCIDRKALEWLQRISPMAGIACSTKIGIMKYGNRTIMGRPILNGNDKSYCLNFVKDSMSESFFVRAKHLDRFVKRGQSSKRWRIEKVIKTGKKENVYCVVEPEDGHFVLEGNILTHNCTIYVKDHEWMEVGAWVYKHFDEISGLSFLPHSGHVYRQAPYEECDEKTYKEALARLPKEIDWSQFVRHELEDNTTSSHELACSAGSCDLTLMP